MSELPLNEIATIPDLTRHQLAVINRFSHQVLSSLSVHEVVQNGLKGIMEVVKPDLDLLYLIEGDCLHLEDVQAQDPVFIIKPKSRCQLGECLCGMAARMGESIFSEDINADSRCVREDCRLVGMKTFAAIPLVFLGKTLGVLGLGNIDRDQCDLKAYSEFLEILANYMALAIKNATYIDDLRQSNELLRQSRDKWGGIFEMISDSVMLVDNDQRILDANPATLELLNLKIDQVIGKHCYDLIHMQCESPQHCPFQLMLKTRLPQWQIMMMDASGKEMLISLSPVFDRLGNITGAIHYARDVTELRQIQKERTTLIEELEQKNRNLEQFVYTASHDLKSPLVGINGFIGLLQTDLNKNDRAAVQRDLTYIRESAMKMYDLINDLLQFSRLGYDLRSQEKVDVTDLINDIIKTLRSRFDVSSARITLADNLPVLFVERLRITQVFQNLIENSLKFSQHREVPQIDIGCRQDDGEWVFYVKDNGLGIDPKYCDRVFDLFQQLNPDIEGTGVGLTIIRRIIEMNGGRIWVETPGLDQGCTICFTLGRQCFASRPDIDDLNTAIAE